MPERFYVTTPIYYVNDVPHIGHAYTTVTADALARWHRLLGEDVFFLTGTDEHGLKVQRAAEANGITAQEQADRTSARFREAWELLGISNDDFIRTTEPRHTASVQAFMQAIFDNGWIRKDTYAGSTAWPARPTTPMPISSTATARSTFGRSSGSRRTTGSSSCRSSPSRCSTGTRRNPGVVQPDGKRNEALGLIRQGLEDVSISRTSIDWGVPVPWDDGHVFYVWYDALINYATAVGYGTDGERFDAWWPEVHHLIGKDILRFHCVYWPAMCLAAGIEPPKKIAVHGFLLVGGEKMSKTSLNQIFPADLVADFGVDGFRYQFLRDTPFGPDGDFSYEQMVTRYNTDLANNLGNLLARVATVVAKKCGGVGPAPSPDSTLAEVAAEAYAATARGVGGDRPERGPRGDVAAHRRRQRPPRSPRALEDGAGPRRSTSSWATCSRCSGSSPSSPARPCRRRAVRCGRASAWRVGRRTSAFPWPRRGVPTPAGCRS